MAASTSIEQLPLDILECIVGYLAIEDLSKCCTICKSWREVFSDDIFWRKHCNVQLSVSLESATCLVKPNFIITDIGSLVPVTGWRLCFLREQHYLKNLRSGSYQRKEIVFECDDSICYNIKVEFVANDFVFLHRTYETQVWNVAQEPNLVMKIPFQLKSLWDKNLYRFYQNKLIVVQCNVVQIFNICLVSKTWSFHCTFFLDRPEEFSLNITKDTDIKEMFQNTFYGVNEKRDTVERVVCSNFLVGIIATKTYLQDQVMHIWDLNSTKKVKEEKCSEYFGPGVTDIFLETSSSSNDNILVSYRKNQNFCVAVYNLVKLKFLTLYTAYNRNALLCDGYLCIYDFLMKEISKYNLDTSVEENVYKFGEGRLDYWHAICDKVVVVSSNDIILINPQNKTVDLQVQSFDDFQLGGFEVVKNKYLALHDLEESMRELLELRLVDKSRGNKQNNIVKLFTLPPDSGTFRATNDVCTKMILERANKLIVLNFW